MHDDEKDEEQVAGILELQGPEGEECQFMPGEHDAGLDEGEAFKEFFGETHYIFDYKGVHFIVLDNVSDPTSTIGETQLKWLSADLKQRDKDFANRGFHTPSALRFVSGLGLVYTGRS